MTIMNTITKQTRKCSPAHRTCTPAHCDLVESYRCARQADLDALESATGLYATEVREYRRTHRPITFKRWLLEGAAR